MEGSLGTFLSFSFASFAIVVQHDTSLKGTPFQVKV